MLSSQGNGPDSQRYWLPKCYIERQCIKFLNILILIFTLQTISVLIGVVHWLSSDESHLQISLAVILGKCIIVLSLSLSKIRGLQSLFYLNSLPNPLVETSMQADSNFQEELFPLFQRKLLWRCLFKYLFNFLF